MSTQYIKVGDEVAVLPSAKAPVSETLEICAVVHAGAVYIKLADGRLFATIGGNSLLSDKSNAIVPVTDEHRQSLHLKHRKAGWQLVLALG